MYKYLITLCLIFLLSHVRGQMKGDTTKPCTRCWPKIEQSALIPSGSLFDDIVFLLQQNKDISDRLDRAESRIDSLERRPVIYVDRYGNIWAKDSVSGFNVQIFPPVNYK